MINGVVFMLKFAAILIFVIFSNALNAQAATNINSYVIKQGVLTFSTKSEKSTVPACVTFRNQRMWAVKLDTPAGGRIVAQLKQAILNQQQVEVTSAGDCADKEGTERPSQVVLVDA